nr:MAG TPA: helix-turn-helix domain protein [Caudoviricetes sp.]
MSRDQRPKLMTTAEVADYLGMSVRQLERWRQEGKGPDYMTLGRTIRYHPARVVAYLHTSQHTTGRHQ